LHLHAPTKMPLHFTSSIRSYKRQASGKKRRVMGASRDRLVPRVIDQRHGGK
jgi:hypothetical protein